VKPTLKAPGSKLLKVLHKKLLSNFGFKFDLCRYSSELLHPPAERLGRGLHSSTFQINLSRFGHTCPCSPV
jgi:hypothetical protein